MEEEDHTIKCPILSIKISGFRSLRDFKLDIYPGLNIITGRNGSGKTNFIDFLDFLSLYIEDGLGAAVSTLGGTSRVFSQEAIRSKSPRVQVEISGLAILPQGTKLYQAETDTPYFRFDYNLEVRIAKSAATVFISKESLTFYRLTDQPTSFDGQRGIGKLEVVRKFDPETQSINTSYSIGPRLASSAKTNPLSFLARPYMRSRNDQRPSEIRVQYLEEILGSLDDGESLISRSYYFLATIAISRTLARARAFNFLPSQIRKLSNITDEPDILPDGSGLSAALYHMSQAREHAGRTRYSNDRYMYGITPDALPKVVNWTNFLLPELEGISATADLSTGKYIASFSINSPSSPTNLKVPFQSASDGTLKWLALSCKLAQNPTFFSIEEPENFLHPQMQSFLIELLREVGSQTEPNYGFVILSTHSETIINNCAPDELIVFEFSDQKTKCRRITNEENLIEQMNKTGFGLGHYYVSNALS